MESSTQQRLDQIEKGFKYFLYKILNITYGLPLAIIGIIVSLYLGNSSIQYAFFALYIIISIIIIATLFVSSFELYDLVRDLKNKKLLPRTIEARKPYIESTNAKALCIIEPSDFYSYDTLVSFYYQKEHLERLISLGEVVNIQEDQFIQIELNYLIEGNEKIVEKLIQNNAECLKHIRIKSFIPKGYVNRFIMR